MAVVILDEVAEAMKAKAGHVGEICPLRHNLHDLLEHWLHLLYGEMMKLGHVHEPLSIDISIHGLNESTLA